MSTAEQSKSEAGRAALETLLHDDGASSSFEGLEPDVDPSSSPEEYTDFFKSLIEIFRNAIRLVPAQISAFVKLAADLVLSQNQTVYSDLCATLKASLIELADTEAVRLTDCLEQSNFSQKRKDAYVERVGEFLKELKQSLENFNKFPRFNKIDAKEKRELEKSCFAEFFESSKKVGANLEHFGDKLLKLAENKAIFTDFLVLKRTPVTEIVCSMLIIEMGFSYGPDLFRLFNDNPSMDFVKTTRNKAKQRVEDFKNLKYDPQHANRDSTGENENFNRVIKLLQKVIIDYCKASGIEHIQTISIMAINILLSKNVEECRALFTQMKCFLGKKCKKTEIYTLEEDFLSTKQLLVLNLITRKMVIQHDCLLITGYKPRKGLEKEFYNPLSLINSAKLNDYGCRLVLDHGPVSPFKGWNEQKQAEFVSTFMIKACVDKTQSLMSFKNAMEGALKKVAKTGIVCGGNLILDRVDDCLESESSDSDSTSSSESNDSWHEVTFKEFKLNIS